MSSKRLVFNLVVAIAIVVSLVPFAVPSQVARAAGSISLTTLGSSYTQNFDALASSGTSSAVPDGWDFSESGTNANTIYTAGTGSSTTGDTYSFGATSSSERAFGGLRSGSLVPTIGAQFTNNTGSTINTLAISYTGEMWREGVTNRGAADRMDFQLSTNATSLATGTWVDYDSLDFNSPNISATAGALDGNASLNRATLSFTITGLNIANGSSVWIRWTDFDITSSDDGLAVDDFSLTPDTVVVPTNPSGVGAAAPSTVTVGGSTLLTVAVTPGSNPTSTGLAVTCDLTAIGGSAAQTFFDDNTNGDVVAGDNTFSFQATVDSGTSAGAKSLPCTITDAQARSGSASISLTVQLPPPPAGDLVINEIDYDQPSTDTAEFVEVRNNDSVSVDLSSYSIEMINGNAGGAAQYRLFALPAVNLAPGDYFVLCANNATVANCDLDVTPETDLIQNGAPDAVALLFNGSVVDTVSYEGNTGSPYTEGSGIGLEDPGTTSSVNLGISRLPDGVDTNQNNVDLSTRCITPGEANSTSNSACAGGDIPPTVASTNPTNGTTNVSTSGNIDINFSENVTVTESWFSISCANSGAHTATVSGGPQNYTLNPDTDFAFSESCTVTVFAANVADQDGTPDNMAANFVFSFTTAAQPFGVCGDPATLIHDIQGSGLQSPLNLTTGVIIEGIVVGDYQDSGQFSGFHVQEEDVDVDGDPATSEGIFVFNSSVPVNAGDLVRVRGRVFEFSTSGVFLTELSPVTDVAVCSSGNSVTPTTVTLPVTSLTDWERYEGMLINILQDLAATENFTLGRFGEVSLSVNGRLRNPTNIVPPGAPAIAQQDLNDRSRIVLDDGDNQQNIDPTIHPIGGLSASNTLRSGYTVNGLSGVLEQRFGVYRVQPVGPISFNATNPRSAAPAPVGGNLKVAALNVLNFFTTLDTGSPICGPTGGLDCRGANSAFEFTRQRDKIINAILAINPDIAGLMEVQNDASATIQNLVDGLNDVAGAGTYAYINTGTIGTDAIKVALIYKPAAVTPAGSYAILNSSVDPLFIDTKNRPSLAQTFERNTTGAKLTVVVNHLKSKGSDCNDVGDPDTGDGQGNCNLTRNNAATALVNWLATDPTGSGDPDFLIVGDMNSYAREDPITTIKNAGYTNLLESLIGADAYSYVFDGQSGYLDHALASASLATQTSGVTEWHNNADEPTVLDYNVEFKTANQINTFYTADPFRASDHDPVVVGLNLNAPPTVDAGGPYNAGEGGSVIVTASGNDPDGGSLTYAWDLDNNGSFETAGQSATFDAAALDGLSSYPIAVQVTDSGGLTAVSPTVVNVLNIAPTINSVTNTGPINEGASATITVNATDPAGANDPLSYEFDCNNDGAYEVGPQAASSAACAFADNGSFVVNARVADGDGGVATGSTTVTVNNVAPAVNTPSISPEPSFKGSSVVASATFSDPGVNDAPFTCTVNYGDGSGNLPGTVSGNLCTGPAHAYSTIGSYAVAIHVTDKDNATGSNTVTHAVIFNFSGFFRPVANPPALNVVKAGWIVPVRFSLNGYQGLNIFAAGYPQTRAITCAASAQEVNVDETIAAGPSLLLYNPFTGRYIYIWKTARAWAGTCRQLVVKLTDGTEHLANFKFK